MQERLFGGGGGLVTMSCLTLATLWIIAYKAPLSMGFPRQQYWNGLPLPSPGDISDPGTEPTYPALQADSLPAELRGDKYTKPNTKFALPSNIVYNTHTQTHMHTHTARSGSDEKNCSSQLFPTCLSPQGLL